MCRWMPLGCMWLRLPASTSWRAAPGHLLPCSPRQRSSLCVLGRLPGFRGLGWLWPGCSWLQSWLCCTGGAHFSEAPQSSPPLVFPSTSSPSHGAGPAHWRLGQRGVRGPQAWPEATPPLTVLGGGIFVPAHALCSSLSFLGPGLPCVCQTLSTQQFGLLPLSSGGGASVQALSLFARAHESGGAAGGCKVSAMPLILS